jgi:flagellar basal-body rod modification protein FlgD
MSTSPINPNPGAGSPNSSSSSSSSSPAQSSIDALGDPNTFLQLLVAQLQYQDPESPADGTAFVTQLATFAGVEQQAQMRTDLDSIDSIAEQFAASAAATPTASTPSTNTSSVAPSAARTE